MFWLSFNLIGLGESRINEKVTRGDQMNTDVRTVRTQYERARVRVCEMCDVTTWRYTAAAPIGIDVYKVVNKRLVSNRLTF